MNNFLHPIVTFIDGNYALHESYIRSWLHTDGKLYRVCIPFDFIWDGASVFRILWTLGGLTPGGRMLGPSCVHDFFYRKGGFSLYGTPFALDYTTAFEVYENDVWVITDKVWTRQDADDALKILMEMAGYTYRQYLAYAYVKTFGWLVWQNQQTQS